VLINRGTETGRDATRTRTWTGRRAWTQIWTWRVMKANQRNNTNFENKYVPLAVRDMQNFPRQKSQNYSSWNFVEFRYTEFAQLLKFCTIPYIKQNLKSSNINHDAEFRKHTTVTPHNIQTYMEVVKAYSRCTYSQYGSTNRNSVNTLKPHHIGTYIEMTKA
jgi:hypothetical protein